MSAIASSPHHHHHHHEQQQHQRMRAPSQRRRSSLRVRDVADGLVYHLVFEGDVERLSGRQLRQHLAQICHVPMESQQLYVRGTPFTARNLGSEVGLHSEDMVELMKSADPIPAPLQAAPARRPSAYAASVAPQQHQQWANEPNAHRSPVSRAMPSVSTSRLAPPSDALTGQRGSVASHTNFSQPPPEPHAEEISQMPNWMSATSMLSATGSRKELSGIGGQSPRPVQPPSNNARGVQHVRSRQDEQRSGHAYPTGGSSAQGLPPPNGGYPDDISYYAEAYDPQRRQEQHHQLPVTSRYVEGEEDEEAISSHDRPSYEVSMPHDRRPRPPALSSDVVRASSAAANRGAAGASSVQHSRSHADPQARAMPYTAPSADVNSLRRDGRPALSAAPERSRWSSPPQRLPLPSAPQQQQQESRSALQLRTVPEQAITPAPTRVPRAEDLAQLLDEEEYIWKMEEYRFRNDESNRAIALANRRRELTFEATRCDHAVAMVTQQLQRERHRLTELEGAMSLNTSALQRHMEGFEMNYPWKTENAYGEGHVGRLHNHEQLQSPSQEETDYNAVKNMYNVKQRGGRRKSGGGFDAQSRYRDTNASADRYEGESYGRLDADEEVIEVDV